MAQLLEPAAVEAAVVPVAAVAPAAELAAVLVELAAVVLVAAVEPALADELEDEDDDAPS